MREAVSFSQERPVLVDRFLEDATEVDVDALADGQATCLSSIMEHIEVAGVHSGDSSCNCRPIHSPKRRCVRLKITRCALAKALHVIGLMNVQYAIQSGIVYVLK